jgi:hypothetical protein
LALAGAGEPWLLVSTSLNPAAAPRRPALSSAPARPSPGCLSPLISRSNYIDWSLYYVVQVEFPAALTRQLKDGPAYTRTGLVQYASTLDAKCARAICGRTGVLAPGRAVKKRNLQKATCQRPCPRSVVGGALTGRGRWYASCRQGWGTRGQGRASGSTRERGNGAGGGSTSVARRHGPRTSFVGPGTAGGSAAHGAMAPRKDAHRLSLHGGDSAGCLAANAACAGNVPPSACPCSGWSGRGQSTYARAASPSRSLPPARTLLRKPADSESLSGIACP